MSDSGVYPSSTDPRRDLDSAIKLPLGEYVLATGTRGGNR